MPRFVILHHETPPDYPRPSHWDCMLEVDSVLVTWSLPQLLNGQPQQMMVEQLADHRLEYLHYEGPISKNRGTVSRVEWGEFHWRSEATRRKTKIEVELRGQKLAGVLKIVRNENDDMWQLDFTPSSVQ